MKKVLSVILTISLLLAVTVSVNAAEKNTIGEIALDKEITLKAVDVSESILSVLSENGAKINNDSVIKILPVEDSADTAVCVTNVEDEIIESDIFMVYEKDESGNFVVDNSMAKALAQGADHNISINYPPTSWDGRYIVSATATAAAYVDYDYDPFGWDPFYKPYKCSFKYTNYDNVNVNSIDVRYITSGTKYSYPGFEFMNEDYSHMVQVYRANPVEGTTYTNYNYFPEDFVLSCVADDAMLLTFINVINGVEYSYSVRLTNEF